MTKDLESRFIDILNADTAEAEKLREEIEANSTLKESFASYQEVVKMEQRMAQQEFSISHDFTDKIMAKLKPQRQTTLKRVCSMVHLRKRFIWQSVAICFLILLTVKLSWKHEFLKERLADFESSGPSEPLKSVSTDAVDGKMSNSKADLSHPPETTELNLKKLQLNEVAEQEVSKERENPPKPLSSRGIVANEARVLSDKSVPERSRKQMRSEERAAGALQHDDQALVGVMPPVPAPGEGLYQAPVDRESYVNYAENRLTSVSEQPVSTFSVDVDTGSYTNSRRFLQSGQRPPSSAVRIEEFINYFAYDYPSQTEKPFGLTYEIAPSSLEPSRSLLRLGIKAKDVTIKETPWNLVFLVDVSGSMSSQDKLPLVKQALKILVGRMKSQDKVSIVTYSGHAGILLHPTGIQETSKIISAIDSLGAGGSTHGSAGIVQAYALAESARIRDGVNRVILATDGDFNVGITDRSKLIELIEKKRENGTTLTTLGFGSGNYQEATMEQLANKGNGNYFYIDSFKEARKVFQTDLTGTIEVVAKDVKIQVEFNPEQVTKYRLVGYENRKLLEEEFDNDRIDAGEIGSGHTVTALYEVVLADSPLAREENERLRYEGNRKKTPSLSSLRNGELGFLKIRYKEPDGDKSELLEFPLRRAEVKDDASKASVDFRFVTAVSGFAHLLRESRYSGEYTFADIIRLAEGALGEDPHGYRREFIELVRNAQSIK